MTNLERIKAIGCTKCRQVVINPGNAEAIKESHNAYHGFEPRKGTLNIVRYMSFLSETGVTTDPASAFLDFTIVDSLASL